MGCRSFLARHAPSVVVLVRSLTRPVSGGRCNRVGLLDGEDEAERDSKYSKSETPRGNRIGVSPSCPSGWKIMAVDTVSRQMMSAPRDDAGGLLSAKRYGRVQSKSQRLEEVD